jgi:hypothetical protein
MRPGRRESSAPSTAHKLGLVDNNVAAIDADWSDLRFVRRREQR